MKKEKEKVICGIQQVGIGVEDLNTAWKWYNKNFNIEKSKFNKMCNK